MVGQGDFFEMGAGNLARADFQMVEYRIYEIGEGDHIVKATALACKDDHEAIATAREIAAGRVVEIWNGERFVARLGAED
jgi:hypothetical protein